MPFLVEPIPSATGAPSALLAEVRSRLMTPANMPVSAEWVVDEGRHCALLGQGGHRGGEEGPNYRLWLALDRRGIYRLVATELADERDKKTSTIRRKFSLGRFGGELPGYSDPGLQTLKWVAEALRVYEQRLMEEYYGHVELALVDARTGVAL